jgi:plasmid maintenance system antidote protein VapI
MRTTGDFLDEFKRAMGWRYDRALAHSWGVPKQKISDYRHGRAALPEHLALQIAEKLGVEKGVIYLSQAIERARRQDDEPLARSLAEIAKKAGILATAIALHASSPAPSDGVESGYYGKSRRKQSRDGSRPSDQEAQPALI